MQHCAVNCPTELRMLGVFRTASGQRYAALFTDANKIQAN
jgi:hypothetical protein